MPLKGSILKLRAGGRGDLGRSESLEDMTSKKADMTSQTTDKETKFFTRWNSARIHRTSGLSLFSKKPNNSKTVAKATESRVLRRSPKFENRQTYSKEGATAKPDIGLDLQGEKSPKIKRSTKEKKCGYYDRQLMKENIDEKITLPCAENKSKGVAREFVKSPLGSLSAMLSRPRNADGAKHDETKRDKKRRNRIRIKGFGNLSKKVSSTKETDETMGNNGSKNENKPKSEDVKNSAMDESKTEEKITVLQNKAARDRIAARPQHRRARTRRVHVPANIKEESAVSEFDIPASIFAPIENAKKPDLPIEKEEEEKDKTPETKPNDLEEDVKSRRKSVGLDLAEEAAKKSSAVKKSRSFKSSLGANVMVPSLNDVSKVKLRKTNSSASPKRSPSFGSRRLSPKEIEEPATEKSSSKSITKGLAHKLSFGKKNKPEGYEKSNKDSKNTDELKNKSSKDERPSKLNWIAGSKSKNEKQNVKSPTENTEPTAKSNLPVSSTGDDLAKALEKRREANNKQEESKKEVKTDLENDTSNKDTSMEVDTAENRFVKLKKVNKEKNGPSEAVTTPTDNKPPFSPLRQSSRTTDQSENEKDKPEHKSEKDESEGSSPFPVKLRQTNRSKKLYEEKPKDKADKSEKKSIGVTENTKEIIPTKSDAAVSKKSSFNRNRNNNNNNANSHGIIPVSSANSQQENKANTISVKPKEKKSPPKIPVKPKQLLTPKNNSTIKEILPLNQESPTVDKEEQKSSPKSPDKPAWVSLARKRSKKWETPKTDTGNSKQEQEFPIHVDDTPPSNNSTTSDQKQVEVPQSPIAKLTSDEPPNVVLKVNPPTNPRLQKPALSLEEKSTNPPKPALRSISADISISKNTAENRRALKTQSCVIPSSKTTAERDPPNWLEVAMQKKKRWLPKEVVDSTIDI